MAAKKSERGSALWYLQGPSVSTIQPGLLAVCERSTRHEPAALQRQAALRFALAVTEAARDWICVSASSRSALISAELFVLRLSARQEVTRFCVGGAD